MLSFVRSNSGSIAVAFALSLTGIAVAAGIILDHSRASNARTRVQNAADSTVLMAAKLSSSGKSDAEVSTAATTFFRNLLTDGIAPNASLSVSKVNSGAWRAVANFDVPTSFGRIIGRDAMPVAAAAEAAASAPAAEYLDIYVLVDVSQSMGLGADPADQSALIALTGCAFACHDRGNGVAIARANNITLRIDAAKAALRSIAQQAQSLSGSGLVVRFSIIEFANEIVRQLPVTGNYGTASSTSADTIFGTINTIDMVRFNAGTSLPYALREAGQRIPLSGSGASAASPRTVAFLITDGMANSNRNISNTEWRTDWNWGSFLPPAYFSGDWSGGTGPSIKAGLACPDPRLLLDQWQNPNPQSYFVNLPSGCVVDPHWLGNETHPASLAGAQRQDQTVLTEIRSSWCADIKRKAHLYTIYTTYFVWSGAGEPTHNYARYAIAPRIPAAMRNCATDQGSAYEARDRSGLASGLNAVFNAATRVSSLKLSR